jgi:predicted ribosomally synthesized peptide with SipW-like signal peptide
MTLIKKSPTTPSSKRQKTMAILAGGLVLGIGATVTLAVWNDSEWVVGGIDANGDGTPDTPGVGTSIFEVQQNVSSPFSGAAWADRESEPGGALTFTAGALSLTPGDSIYAPVSLSTTTTSVAAETLGLEPAISSSAITSVDADGLLFGALQLRVVVAETARADIPATCAAGAFTPTADYVVGAATGSVALATGGSVDTSLASAGTNKQDYCFEISLPSTAPSTLQGRSVAPAWQFIAASLN